MKTQQPEKYLDRPEVVAEIKRELTWRERCYPKWIKQGRLKREDAERQYRALRTALRVLENTTDQQYHDALEDAKAKISRQQKLFK